MEQRIPLAECFPEGAGGCRIETCCALKVILGEAAAAFFAVLDRYSVRDLVHGNSELRAFILAGPTGGATSTPHSERGIADR